MFSIILIATLALGASQSTAANTYQQTLTQEVDEHRFGLCAGPLIGFRNVPMRCTVGQDGAFGQCEILTDHRLVRRHSRKFHCMASHIRLLRPDGSPASGEVVSLKFDAGSIFTESYITATGRVE